MRRWLNAGVAAVIALTGTAGAVEPTDGSNAREPRTTSSEATADGRGPAMARGPADATPAQRGDRTGFVTRDELMRVRASILEQVERERAREQPAPTFTDAG